MRVTQFRSNLANHRFLMVFLWLFGGIIGLGMASSTASAKLEFTFFEIEAGTYYPGDPVAMALSVMNTHPETTYNPVVVDVHLTQGGQFRRGNPITDHVLNTLNGPSLRPGDSYTWYWVQRMPGNLPGNFIVDAEVYTSPGSAADFAEVLSYQNPVLVEAAKITLMAAEHPETEIVSSTQDGSSSNSLSETPSISAHGRWIAFASEATNLVPTPGDDDDDDDEDPTPGDDDDTPISRIANIFVKDYWTGEVEKISRPVTGSELDTSAFRPRISRNPDDLDLDGRWIVFHTASRNIVGGVTNPHNDVYLYDRETKQLERISVGPNGEEGNQASQNASVSGDGRFVVFESEATNLIPGDTNGVADIYLYDRDWETEGTERLRRVNVTNTGSQALGGHSRDPRISSDGKQIVFESLATNLGDSPSEVWEIYVHNRDANRNGILDEIGGVETVRLSRQYDANGNVIASDGHSRQADLSPDGRFVVFHSEATNLFSAPAEGEIVLPGRAEESILTFSENVPGSATIGLIPDVFASGTIVFESNAEDGDTVTIDDGTGPQTFEFDGPVLTGVEPGNIEVIVGATAASSRENLVRAINRAFGGTIRAETDNSSGSPGIFLENVADATANSDQPITTNADPRIIVTGIGGAESRLPAEGDTLVIDTKRFDPVTVEFFDADLGTADPTDLSNQIIGVQIGETAAETAQNLFNALRLAGYQNYDIPDLPDYLLPPTPSNPGDGEWFDFEHEGRTTRFTFRASGPQFDPDNPRNVRIDPNPAVTRGNLIRAIIEAGYSFESLPASADGADWVSPPSALGSLPASTPAQGEINLLRVPSSGFEIEISDKADPDDDDEEEDGLSVTFRFVNEREQTEEEEENETPVPPYEEFGDDLFLIYLIQDMSLDEIRNRLLGAIQSSELDITARGTNPISLLNNSVGPDGNTDIGVNPLPDPDDESIPDWIEVEHLDGGETTPGEVGDQIVFYNEQLLHPRVVFEFGASPSQARPNFHPVRLGETGEETEGNFIEALIQSGMPWVRAELDEEGAPSVILTSNVGTASGEIPFDLTPSDPDVFVLDTVNGEIRTPRDGGKILINDPVHGTAAFEFTLDGRVEEGNIPVSVGTTGESTRDNFYVALEAAGLAIDFEIPESEALEIWIRSQQKGLLPEPLVVLEDLGDSVDLSTVSGGWNPLPGEMFQVGDGYQTTIFEFVEEGDSPSEPDHEPIVTADLGDETDQRAEIRDRIIGAIKDAGLALIATPYSDGADPAVHLVHAESGNIGNQSIQILADHPSITVRGMEGGGNLAPGYDQVYIVDRDVNENGIFDELGQMLTELVSITEMGTAGNHRSHEATVSGDGRYVAYQTQAYDLQPLTVTRSDGEVFPNLPRSSLLSIMDGGEDGPMMGLTDSTDLIASFTDEFTLSDIYVYDRKEKFQTRVSVNRFGEGVVGNRMTREFPYSNRGATMSVDGNTIVFESDNEPYSESHHVELAGDGLKRGGGLWHGVTNRETLDHNDWRDIFVHDRKFADTTSPTFPGIVELSLPDIVGSGEVTIGSLIDIKAEISGILPGRTAAGVQFFANGELIGTATQPAIPGSDIFAIRWLPQAATTYQIVALATDSFGRNLPMSQTLTVTAKRAEGEVRPAVGVINPPIEDDLVPENAFSLTDRSVWPFGAAALAGTRPIERVDFMIRTLTPAELEDDFIDNGLGGVLMGVAQKEPTGGEEVNERWRYNFDLREWGTAGLPIGYYAVWAIARDTTGTITGSQAIPIRVRPGEFDPPTVRLTVRKHELNREETNDVRVQVDSPYGQTGQSSSEVYLFANAGAFTFTDHDNPQTSRPFVWDNFEARYSGVVNFIAVAKDDFGNTAVSNVVQVVVHPWENIVGNPADPDQSAAFVFQMYQDLLLRPNDAPSTALVRNYVRALETDAKTRGEVVAELLKDPDFEAIRYVIAAYLTVLQEPPTYDQLIDGVERLRGGEDDDDQPGQPDDEEGRLDPGVPSRLPGLISRILDSDEFWMKYIRTEKIRYDERGELDMENLLREVHRGQGTHKKKQERLAQMESNGRTGYLANLTHRRLQEDSSHLRELERVALILLLLHRDTSLEEARLLPKRTADAADYLVAQGEFIAEHGGADSFLQIVEQPWDPKWTVLGIFDKETEMYLKDSVWLGALNDEHFNHATETGWIKHVEHGWLYAAPGSRTENGVWLWDDIQQGWFWTSSELYPLIFSDADGMWLYYEEGGTPESRDFQIYNGTGWGSSRNVR